MTGTPPVAVALHPVLAGVAGVVLGAALGVALVVHPRWGEPVRRVLGLHPAEPAGAADGLDKHHTRILQAVGAIEGGGDESSDEEDEEEDEEGEEEDGGEEKQDADSDEEEDGERLKMVLLVRSDLKMGRGKIAAQCGHAAVGLYRRGLCQPDWCQNILDWQHRGVAKITLKVDDEAAMDAVTAYAAERGLPTFTVRDAGHTQVAPGTRTVAAYGPAPESVVNSISGKTGKFPLALLS